MTWQIPWVISEVTEIPLDVARVMAYTATGGMEGVVGSADLQVKQLGTPGTSVTVAGGAFVCNNRYSAGSPQSYIGYNVGIDTKAVTANGGGATRYDLVYAHVTDPSQPGNPATPAAVETRIIQGVTSTTVRLADVSGFESTAGLALARIAIPASTSVITQAMITDLRILSQTRNIEVTKIMNMGSGSTDNQVGGSFGLFPNLATWSVDVPSWASRMAAIGWIDGLEIRGTSSQQWVGQMRLKMGATVNSAVTDINTSLQAGVKDTVSSLAADDRAIPSAERGTAQTFRFEAVKTSGSAALWATHGTVAVLQITFYNQAETT